MRLSPTDLGSFLFCGHAWYLGKIRGMRGLRGAPLIRGLGVHEAAAHNYRHKKETHTDLPIDIISDVARGSVIHYAEEGLSPDPEDGRSEKDRVGGLVDKTVGLAKMYHREIAPHVQPILVEEKVELEVSPEVTLVSILDVQGQDGTIADIKTAGRAKTQAEADRSLQLTMQYAAAEALANQRGTPHVHQVRLDVLVDTKVPKVQQLYSTRDARDLSAMVEIANAVKGAISAGVFLPVAPTTTWKCNPQYCEHFHNCKFVSGK